MANFRYFALRERWRGADVERVACLSGIPEFSIWGVGKVLSRDTPGLIRVLAVEHAQQGHRNNLEIEGEAPVAQVIEIVFHALGD